MAMCCTLAAELVSVETKRKTAVIWRAPDLKTLCLVQDQSKDKDKDKAEGDKEEQEEEEEEEEFSEDSWDADEEFRKMFPKRKKKKRQRDEEEAEAGLESARLSFFLRYGWAHNSTAGVTQVLVYLSIYQGSILDPSF